MKKDILKGFTMFTLIVVIALASAVVSANAQSSQLVTSNVPFEFIVGDKTLPAGEYRVSQALSKGLTIQSADAKNSAIRLANDIQANKTRKQARLVFHRYGNRYFLSEVWSGPDSTGRQVVKSRQERAIERELASIASKSEHAESTYAIVQVAAVLR
jgi:hypothetical protein